MNVLAYAIRTMKMGMKDLGKAARSAAITGPREIIKPSLNLSGFVAGGSGPAL